MTTATRAAIEQIELLSAAELAELQAWLDNRRTVLSVSAVPSAPVSSARHDFARDLRESWGDAPPMAENAVLAMRAEERS